jgi:hypothetical protein
MFSYILTYAKNRNQADRVYFPLFLMGNSIQSLLYTVLRSTSNGISSLSSKLNKNLSLRWLVSGSTTFLGGNLTDTEIKTIMEAGTFLNRNSIGVLVSDFKKYSLLTQDYTVCATFKTSTSSTDEWIAVLKH